MPVTAPRGFILDRNGVVLAENEPSFTLLLYRRETKDLDASLRFVADLFNRPFDELKRRVERDRSYYDFVPVVLQENLTVSEVGAVQARALEHPELVVQKTERRVYTQGTVAAHLLGQLGEATAEQVAARAKAHPGDESLPRPGEAIGQQGVEASYQDLLAGVSGSRSYVIDSFGREVGESGHVDPMPGNTLQLTIDAGLQHIAEDYFAGKVGSAVALDPKTGEVLALVSAPAYDPNLFTRRVTRAEWDEILTDPNHPLNNRVLQNLYSPGSTWKPFMAYAILKHGIDPKERVFCPGGLTFYGRPFRCHGKHGSVDLATALQVSCDSYFYTMGKRLGIDAIAETGKHFGFGRTYRDRPRPREGRHRAVVRVEPRRAQAPVVRGRDDLRRDRPGPGPRLGPPARARDVRHRERGRRPPDAAPLPHRRERALGRALRLPARGQGVRDVGGPSARHRPGRALARREPAGRHRLRLARRRPRHVRQDGLGPGRRAGAGQEGPPPSGAAARPRVVRRLRAEGRSADRHRGARRARRTRRERRRSPRREDGELLGHEAPRRPAAGRRAGRSPRARAGRAECRGSPKSSPAAST